jgi:DNA-binding XRE family transcriptional regulator
VKSVGKWNPVAIRLRVLRRALFDENVSQFARRLGISTTRLLNIEKGYPLSIDVAIKIRAAVPGMTPDWPYHGDERSLPMEIWSCACETRRRNLSTYLLRVVMRWGILNEYF